MKMPSQFELVKIDKLIPYVNNARVHSIDQINKIRASMREFGFINPVIIDRNFNVIAGHGRILAAKAEGYKEVPCIYVDHLTETQKKAYILADNRIALDAEWDSQLLKIELETLRDESFDLSLAGFNDKEIEKLLEEFEAIDLDESITNASDGKKLCCCPKCGFEFEV